MDADEVLAAAEVLEFRAMLTAGRTSKEIEILNKQKVFREEASMYSFYETMYYGKATMDVESSLVTPEEIGVHLGIAYENLGRRNLAIAALRRAHERCQYNPRISLLLARLLFRDNQKGASESVLANFLCQVQSRTELIQLSSQITGEDFFSEDVADAYYILGWIAIHADNHTKAYQIWSKGFEVIPSDSRLKRQHEKVRCWRDISNTNDGLKALIARDTTKSFSKLIGSAETLDCDFEAFAIASNVLEPAFSLFDPKTQGRNLIFRSKVPILTECECAAVVRVVNEFVKNVRGKWGSVRSASLPTTDVAVEDIPILRQWLRCLLATTLQPMLAACFPKLADGSDLGPNGERLRVHDAFIVRYDAEQDMSTSLPEHSDTSAISFTVALNSTFEAEAFAAKNGSTNGGKNYSSSSISSSGAAAGGGDVESDSQNQRRCCHKCNQPDCCVASSPRYSGGGTWFRALESSAVGSTAASSTATAAATVLSDCTAAAGANREKGCAERLHSACAALDGLGGIEGAAAIENEENRAGSENLGVVDAGAVQKMLGPLSTDILTAAGLLACPPTDLLQPLVLGHAVAFAGPLRHGGYPVTKGTRYILVLFMYVEDFAYHHLLCPEESPAHPCPIPGGSLGVSREGSIGLGLRGTLEEAQPEGKSVNCSDNIGGSCVENTSPSSSSSSSSSHSGNFTAGSHVMKGVPQQQVHSASDQQNEAASSVATAVQHEVAGSVGLRVGPLPPRPFPPELRSYVVYRETLELMNTLNKTRSGTDDDD